MARVIASALFSRANKQVGGWDRPLALAACSLATAVDRKDAKTGVSALDLVVGGWTRTGEVGYIYIRAT